MTDSFLIFFKTKYLCVPNKEKSGLRKKMWILKHEKTKKKQRTRTLEISLLRTTENKQINLSADVVSWAVALLCTGNKYTHFLFKHTEIPVPSVLTSWGRFLPVFSGEIKPTVKKGFSE